MNTRRYWFCVVCGVWLLSYSGFAQSEPTGFLDPELHKRQIDELSDRADIYFKDVQQPVYKADGVSHVANGLALRDRTRGFVHSRGVPRESRIVKAFLLWNFSDGIREGAADSAVLFDGNLVVGKKTADNTDPCWGRTGNHSYLADVTQFTNQAGGSNQEYEVTIPFDPKTSTGGENPWFTSVWTEVILEGASLIVIYNNEHTAGVLYLFAPPGDNMFFNSASYLLPDPGQGRALFTMVGADGQRGSGHNNFASNELTFFNGTQIAGPAIAASDWDGSDGLPLPQLWDTHTHIVTLNGDVSQLEYTTPGDCLVPVGFVLDLE